VNDIERKQLKVRILLQGFALGLQEVSRVDPAIQAQLRGWNRIIQYSVLPDGPEVHFRVEDGTLTAIPEPHDSPAATIQFMDLDTAHAVLTRRLDPQVAFMEGKLQMKGEVADAMKMGLLAQMVATYLS
jgi:putative sterol carrier protein